jgi:hypothetical protein
LFWQGSPASLLGFDDGVRLLAKLVPRCRFLFWLGFALRNVSSLFDEFAAEDERRKELKMGLNIYT